MLNETEASIRREMEGEGGGGNLSEGGEETSAQSAWGKRLSEGDDAPPLKMPSGRRAVKRPKTASCRSSKPGADEAASHSAPFYILGPHCAAAKSHTIPPNPPPSLRPARRRKSQGETATAPDAAGGYFQRIFSQLQNKLLRSQEQLRTALLAALEEMRETQGGEEGREREIQGWRVGWRPRASKVERASRCCGSAYAISPEGKECLTPSDVEARLAHAWRAEQAAARQSAMELSRGLELSGGVEQPPAHASIVDESAPISLRKRRREASSLHPYACV